MASHAMEVCANTMKVHPHIFCCVRFHVDAVPVVGMYGSGGGGLRVDRDLKKQST